jgi:YebC/PmpR family DNA-binding regulatory protein
MGRAYAVRKASIEKTGAKKGKLYSTYSKEIYQAAKNGGTDEVSNYELRKLLERAKKDQVPNDIIKRAIDKVKSGALETYTTVKYELFGPYQVTVILECLTDNVNRTLGDLRTVLNKTGFKMGNVGSVSYNYSHLSVLGFKNIDELEVLDTLVNNNIEVDDIETEEDTVYVYSNPTLHNNVKEVLENNYTDINFETDEISYIPNETVTLTKEQTEEVNKALTMLEDIDDVDKLYHNI